MLGFTTTLYSVARATKPQGSSSPSTSLCFDRKELLEYGGWVNHTEGERGRFTTSRLTLSTLFNLVQSNPIDVAHPQRIT